MLSGNCEEMSETGRTRQDAKIENITDSFHRFYGRWKHNIRELRESLAKHSDASAVEEIVGAVHNAP